MDREQYESIVRNELANSVEEERRAYLEENPEKAEQFYDEIADSFLQAVTPEDIDEEERALMEAALKPELATLLTSAIDKDKLVRMPGDYRKTADEKRDGMEEYVDFDAFDSDLVERIDERSVKYDLVVDYVVDVAMQDDLETALQEDVYHEAVREVYPTREDFLQPWEQGMEDVSVVGSQMLSNELEGTAPGVESSEDMFYALAESMADATYQVWNDFVEQKADEIYGDDT